MIPEPASAGDPKEPMPPLRGSSFQMNTHPAFRSAPRWAILTPRLRRSAFSSSPSKPNFTVWDARRAQVTHSLGCARQKNMDDRGTGKQQVPRLGSARPGRRNKKESVPPLRARTLTNAYPGLPPWAKIFRPFRTLAFAFVLSDLPYRNPTGAKSPGQRTNPTAFRIRVVQRGGRPRARFLGVLPLTPVVRAT